MLFCCFFFLLWAEFLWCFFSFVPFHHLYMVWLFVRFVWRCWLLFWNIVYRWILMWLARRSFDVSFWKILIARIWDWRCLVLTGKTQRKNSPTVDSDDDSSVSSSSTMRSDRMSVVGIEDFHFDKDTLLDQALDALYEKRYSCSSLSIFHTNCS